MKQQQNFNVKDFQNALSSVKNIWEDFLNSITEKIMQTDSFEASYLINVRLSPEEEVEDFMKSHNITDEKLLEALKFKTICNIVSFSFETQGVKAFVFFYLVDIYDYQHGCWKYKIFSTTVTCPQLCIFDYVLDISNLGKKKIYYMQEFRGTSFKLLHKIVAS